MTYLEKIKNKDKKCKKKIKNKNFLYKKVK